MDKRILFVSKKPTMVAKALIQGLEEASLTVIQTNACAAEIARLQSRPEIWLLYLQENEEFPDDFLTYMQEQIDMCGVKLFMAGTPEALEEIGRRLPRNCIKGTFARPFRADAVAERFLSEISKTQLLSMSKRILVVDDDATMLRSLKELLSPHYHVYTANSGMNAIRLLASTVVDLILLDYEMPALKGPQVLEMLRSEAHTKGIPVMFLTSKNDRDSVVKVLKLGPVNYLLKSLSHSEILTRIQQFFADEHGENGGCF